MTRIGRAGTAPLVFVLNDVEWYNRVIIGFASRCDALLARRGIVTGRSMISDETRRKMSEAKKRYYARIGGYPESARKKQSETNKKRGVGKWMLGRKLPPEVRAKLGRKGEKHHQWAGDNVGYHGIHLWLKAQFGNPQHCENCGILGKRSGRNWNIHWAKKKGFTYERKRENFFGLCASCHGKYDFTEEIRIKLIKSHLGKIPPMRSLAGYMGVSVSGNKWTAHIWHQRKNVYLGTFNSPQEAHQAYIDAAKKRAEGIL